MKRYDMPNKLPSDSINDVLNACQTRMGLRDRKATYENFLADFREGKLGQVFFD